MTFDFTRITYFEREIPGAEYVRISSRSIAVLFIVWLSFDYKGGYRNYACIELNTFIGYIHNTQIQRVCLSGFLY